jgi:phosphotriesterase-related protein
MRRLGLLRRNLFAIRENLLLNDMDTAVAEASEFATQGGGTIVDLTPADVGRDPVALAELARRTGLNVIVGTGHYIHAVHPAGLAAESVASITERLLAEITDGVGDSGVRPGIIGEIGTWHPIHPDELKVLRAAAAAQKATGLALSIHLHIAARGGHEVLDILAAEGVDLSRVILGHLDICFGHLDTTPEAVLEYHRTLADRGCCIEYDTVGTEGFAPGSPVTPPFWTVSDLTRARAVAQLVAEGYGDRILLSHDVFTRSQLVRYGGFGYGHILRDFQHRLGEVGVGPDALREMLVDNPRRMLTPTP